MKQKILLLAVIAGLSIAARAQCDKNVLLSFSKMEMFDSSGNLLREKPDKSLLKITKQEVVITPDAIEERAIKGEPRIISCEWKDPFKNGKTVLKSQLVEPSGEVKDATITIEGKDGKITVFVELEQMPNLRIRLTTESFEAVS